jgi:hypothetical protein
MMLELVEDLGAWCFFLWGFEGGGFGAGFEGGAFAEGFDGRGGNSLDG